MNPFRTSFSENIFHQKYAHEGAMTWSELSNTLVREVCEGLMSESEVSQLVQYISEMKFIPGGRYLYYAGRPNKYYNNCYLLRSEEDTREDWANLSWKAESCLMTGGGIGNDYSIYRPSQSLIARTGGFASGPIPKMEMINEIGRRVMQGGSRRSAIYGSLVWDHGDIDKFLHVKDWENYPVGSTGKTLRDIKMEDFNFPCPLDMTNISVNYNTKWLERYKKTGEYGSVFRENVRQALKGAEPGFSFNFYKHERETLRNAPVSANTHVMTYSGWFPISKIIDEDIIVWTGKQWARTCFQKTKSNVQTLDVVMSNGNTIEADPEHEFLVEEKEGIARVPAAKLKPGDVLHVSFPCQTDNFRVTVKSVSKGAIQDVYCCDVGVAEHSFCAEGVIISNCTEVTSEDDSDVCNLGSANMGRITSIEEFDQVVELATKYLICGTLKAKLPYEKVYQTREKNRRLGLGLMGMHEWLIQRGYRYEVVPELHKWLEIYENGSNKHSDEFADKIGVSRPVAKRAIAPTGSIGILAGTTTGVEPLYAVAYKRRYLKGTKWHYQYVVDAVAEDMVRLYDVDPDKIESAIDLADDYERRMAFQADVQDYVDMSISSTINLPSWGSKLNNDDKVDEFASTLAKYAHRLRGFTCYPDGARGGQPLTSVSYKDAHKKRGVEHVEEYHDVCDIMGKGICGI